MVAISPKPKRRKFALRKMIPPNLRYPKQLTPSGHSRHSAATGTCAAGFHAHSGTPSMLEKEPSFVMSR
jgi:hypothetical protein